MSVFVIAEAGVNHNGDPDRAKKMVEVARDSGADAIKFQTFTAEKLVTQNAAKADYQQRETGTGNQFEMLKSLEMSDELHEQLFQQCNELGIEFMSTPFDEDALDFLMGLGMQRIKIPSGELINHPLLRILAGHDVPLILSTGMGDMAEITEAVDVIAATRRDRGFAAALEDRLTILHCTSNYPAAPSDVNLRAMQTIAAQTKMPVGYSDHTLGTAISTAAAALGASVIEKHFTLDRSLAGPDHSASLEPEELKLLIRNIRDVESAMGDGIKAPTAAEQNIRSIARRSVCAAGNLPKGHVLTATNLELLRPADGIAPKYFNKLQGRILARDVKKGISFQWADFEE
jgi:N,N'-diacetyllegionaminate synthase